MADITIPREAEEAGKDTAFAWLRSHMEDDVRVQQMTDEELTELVSAACLAAAINAWPGMWTSASVGNGSIILPITETDDDK